MATDSGKIHNGAMLQLAGNGGTPWNDGTANFAFILLTEAYTFDAADTEYSHVSANEVVDVDYAPIAVASRTLTQSTTKTQFSSNHADFGTNVTISAKWLVCIAGNAASLGATDKIIFSLDLDNTSSSATIDKSNDAFIVRPNQSTGWFYLEQ